MCALGSVVVRMFGRDQGVLGWNPRSQYFLFLTVQLACMGICKDIGEFIWTAATYILYSSHKFGHDILACTVHVLSVKNSEKFQVARVATDSRF